MNIDEGAMDFEAVMNNDKFIKAIDEAEKRVKGFSSSTVAEGEKIDDAFKITAENIKIQKDVIAGLEGQLSNLNNEISNGYVCYVPSLICFFIIRLKILL